jgi:hypothetical protein
MSFTLLPIILVSYSSVWLFDKFLARKIGVKIDEFYDAHPEKLRRTRERLKVIVQRLIDDLNAYMVRHAKSSEKPVFRLYNMDYRGIRIVGRKSSRGYYAVTLSNE